jgi:hypothetical protein
VIDFFADNIQILFVLLKKSENDCMILGLSLVQDLLEGLEGFGRLKDEYCGYCFVSSRIVILCSDWVDIFVVGVYVQC